MAFTKTRITVMDIINVMEEEPSHVIATLV